MSEIDLMRSMLDGLVAGLLPAAPGSLLVLTAPADFDWSDPQMVERIQGAADMLKQAHGFGGVIILAHGYTMQSFDAEGLRRLGLQVIPEVHGMGGDLAGREVEGSA